MQTVGAPQLRPRLVAMMDRPDLASDARFATPAGRRENWAALHLIICEWLDKFKTVDEAVTGPSAPRPPPPPPPPPPHGVGPPPPAARAAVPGNGPPRRGQARPPARPLLR